MYYKQQKASLVRTPRGDFSRVRFCPPFVSWVRLVLEKICSAESSKGLLGTGGYILF